MFTFPLFSSWNNYTLRLPDFSFKRVGHNNTQTRSSESWRNKLYLLKGSFLYCCQTQTATEGAIDGVRLPQRITMQPVVLDYGCSVLTQYWSNTILLSSIVPSTPNYQEIESRLKNRMAWQFVILTIRSANSKLYIHWPIQPFLWETWGQ